MTFRAKSIVSISASILLGALAAGCSSGPPGIRFQSLENGRSFEQTFSRAYFGEDAGGDFNIVLTEDGLNGASPTAGPLAAAQSAPLRQVVLIHVLWIPQTGAKPDQPSATNAAIDWHLFSNDGITQNNLHYAGAGFVNLSPDGDTAKLKIRTATLSLRDRTGTLQDPLGRSTLSGSFVCVRNDALIKSELEQFRSAPSSISVPDSQPTEEHTPPSRMSTP